MTLRKGYSHLKEEALDRTIWRGIRGRRRRKLLDDLKERRGYSHLKEEALDRTMWRARFGRRFGPVVRQTAKRISDVGVRSQTLCIKISFVLTRTPTGNTVLKGLYTLFRI